MKKSLKNTLVVICMLMVMLILGACDSADSLKEKAESLKDSAEQKYNELAENLVDMDTESLDIQAGYFLYGEQYVVVIKNNSEDKTLSKFAVAFELYDADGNLIEPDSSTLSNKIGPVFPGESAVAVSWIDEAWKEQASDYGYSINTATWGGSSKHVAITETTENYYGNYAVTISNLGSVDADLQADSENWKFETYAIFRDSEGAVTGVSPAYLEEYEQYNEDGSVYTEYPVVPAGSQITTYAAVYDMCPGTPEIVLVWRAANH